MEARLDRKPDAIRIGRATVEHPFGALKVWMGATHFKDQDPHEVRADTSLQVLAYNLKRMIALHRRRSADRGHRRLTATAATDEPVSQTAFSHSLSQKRPLGVWRWVGPLLGRLANAHARG